MNLKEERQKIFYDIAHNTVPTRVPVSVSLPIGVIAEYKGLSMKDSLWNPEIVDEAVDELAKLIYTDTNVFGGNLRIPVQTQAMDSINSIMSPSGMMQHPNTVGLYEDEYDRFIEDPLACIWEVILPRLYPGMDPACNPARAGFNIMLGMNAKSDMAKRYGAIGAKYAKKYDYYVQPAGSGGAFYAPMDFCTDNIRSFSEMSKDIRRCPEKVAAAAEAVLPIGYMVGLPANPDPEGHSGIPCHMPTFMRRKDVDKLWWPTFYRQVQAYAADGIHTRLFCEDDWMRYLDLLEDLPVDSKIQFEKGDPKLVAEKLGGKHMITGLFPLETLRGYSKEECIKRTREFLDIMMPCGKFIFGFDKGPLVYGDIVLENLIAVCDTVRDFGVYPNAGEKAGAEFHQEDYSKPYIPKLKSRSFLEWEEYKEKYPNTPDCARPLFESNELNMVKTAYALLL